MPRPIHHTFAPLALRPQVLQAFRLQFAPWLWRDGPEREALRSALKQRYDQPVSLFHSGRGALLALFQALELAPGEEVIVQGFTCAVVPNAVRAAGGTPVYVDISPRTLSLDPAKVRAAITPRTRAVVCQHTFGIPADTGALRIICNEKQLALIEDCAHVMPENLSERIGMHADAILFSFGRDKAISGVSGGAVLSRHATIAKRLAAAEELAADLSLWQIFNLLCYPLRYAFAKVLWRLYLGKPYLRIVRLLKLLPPILSTQERRGSMQKQLCKFPNALAALALAQLQSLPELNAHRRRIAELFAEAGRQEQWDVPRHVHFSPAPQKFPVLLSGAERVRKKLKQQDIYLDDGWCGAVVNPKTVDQRAAGYVAGSCPEAEHIASHIFCLPTHPSMTQKDVHRLLAALAKILHTAKRNDNYGSK